MAAYKTKFTPLASLLLSVIFLMIATGCTDYNQLKTDLLQAVAKQEEIKSYRFAGSVELKADSSLLNQAGPFATALFSMLKDSKIEYSGISALDPSRMETNLKVMPAAGNSIEIPVLIKDNKLFFHIPALNKNDEYMMLPVQSKLQGESAAGNVEPLKNTGHLTAVLNQQLLNGIDPKWLQPVKESAKSGEETAKRIVLAVNSKNEQAFAEYWETLIPGLTGLLQTNGFASGASLDTWQTTLKQLKFHAPTSVTMLIDKDGFIYEQIWDLTFTAGGSTNANHIVWKQSLSEINQNPAFTKEIPGKQKSLDELLKFTKPAPAVKK